MKGYKLFNIQTIVVTSSNSKEIKAFLGDIKVSFDYVDNTDYSKVGLNKTILYYGFRNKAAVGDMLVKDLKRNIVFTVNAFCINEFLENISSDVEEISDGYHSFNELYKYRMLYNAAFFNLLSKTNKVIKSKKHSDGSIPFNDSNWFIVQAKLENGKIISNHYEIKDWNMFKIPEAKVAMPWSGSTPEQEAEYLETYIKESM